MKAGLPKDWVALAKEAHKGKFHARIERIMRNVGSERERKEKLSFEETVDRTIWAGET